MQLAGRAHWIVGSRGSLKETKRHDRWNIWIYKLRLLCPVCHLSRVVLRLMKLISARSRVAASAKASLNSNRLAQNHARANCSVVNGTSTGTLSLLSTSGESPLSIYHPSLYFSYSMKLGMQMDSDIDQTLCSNSEAPGPLASFQVPSLHGLGSLDLLTEVCHTELNAPGSHGPHRHVFSALPKTMMFDVVA